MGRRGEERRAGEGVLKIPQEGEEYHISCIVRGPQIVFLHN